MSAWINKCHFGDCIETMRGMPDGIVQTCVTSPPYFGLRDYGHAGQIGLEPTPAEFVAKLVDVFREVRRVLRDDGTLWLNLGDSYAATSKGSGGTAKSGLNAKKDSPRGTPGALADDSKVMGQHMQSRTFNLSSAGLKAKDLIGIPWRVAFALQDDGWYLRQDIIWSKPNPMPESIKDRCTKAHEYMFLLSKSPSYYCDMGAIKEPASASSAARWAQNVEAQAGSDRVPGKTNGAMKAVGGRLRRADSTNASEVPGASAHGGLHREGTEREPDDRNKRSVWTVATTPYKGAHFATFPTALIEPCILAGAPAGGVVLDPFFGSGTTGQVAQNLGRAFIGCELNPAYEALQAERLRQMGLILEAA